MGQLAVGGCDDHFVGGRGTGHTDRRARTELHVFGRRAARAAAQHVGADVAGDHRQPRIETPFAGEVGQGFPGPGEGLLRGVFGLVTVVQPAQAEAQQPCVVTGVEAPERARVTRLATLHQDPVAIQVDVVAQSCELFLP